MGCYLRPKGLEDAVAAMADGSYTVLAGGTDFYPARAGGLAGRPPESKVLDITALDGLRGIAEEDDAFRVGALTTWSDLLRAPLPPYFAALKLAAREVGGVQIQNAGTLCGNLCNASPAADGVPPLLAMDAEVELASQVGSRRLALDDFILGNRKTARRPDELVTALYIPKPSPGARSTFLKLGARKYLVISIVMAALLVDIDDKGNVAKARVAVGSCAARALRLPAVEAAFEGRPFDEDLLPRIGEEQLVEPLGPLTPIDDIRGTADYRREAAVALLRRGVEALLSQEAA
ncbi:xanthine dehydrogenase family protein subunit M [Pelagibius sp. CAU 1746]|uniref:FAD binding domain-containing protein n=1 Tax=Pelagibius sp. CAU 1746 TaxID=3140370 RepID=UPI00325AD11E